MPHYKDGSLAKSGDLARNPDGVVGLVAKIVQGDACNALLVHDILVLDVPNMYYPVIVAQRHSVIQLKECELVYRKAE